MEYHPLYGKMLLESVGGHEEIVAAVRSVVNTTQRQGINAFEAITKVLSFASPDFLFKPG